MPDIKPLYQFETGHQTVEIGRAEGEEGPYYRCLNPRGEPLGWIQYSPQVWPEINHLLTLVDRRQRTIGRRAEDAQIPDALDTGDFRKVWFAYLAWRRAEHPGWSTRKTWAEMQFEKMAKWGAERAIAALRWSSGEDYQAIVEPKGRREEAPAQAAPHPAHRRLS